MILREALEVHNELNPNLWEGTELKQDVKEKLLEIAQTFIDGLDFPINVADIRFLGSNASYNYNPQSDIDLHIVSNFDLVYIDKDILQTLYNNCKNNFNRNHDITIKGIPVELYIEDMASMNATNGSYSLLKDEWIKFPEPIEYEIPDYSKELAEMEAKVNDALQSTSKEEVENLINEIYLGRKDGLATDGEASIGNLVFKELRNAEALDRLRERFYDLESQELTLENKLLEHKVPENGSEEEIKEKEQEYKEYIATHIANVHNAYERIVKNIVLDDEDFDSDKIKQLVANLDRHDNDKSEPFIFDAYRRNHYPINDKEKEDANEDYEIAWFYHKKNNTHHWEYWLNSADEFAQNINEYEMKLAYYEMLCDWLSFGFRKDKESATGESTEFEIWYNDSKKNIKIHPEMKKWFDGIISQVLGYIKDNRDEIYKEDGLETMEKYLTYIETYGKLEDSLNKDVSNKRGVKLEMNYREFKQDTGFVLDYNVKLPLKFTQESDFDVIEDEMGRDVELDVDLDSLWDAEQKAFEEVEEMFSDEDYLKEIFPTVGRGRVYPELISLEEDMLEFNIGFSDIVDPVEEGNEIRLDEKEIIEQIKDLAENVIDNIGYIDARQYIEVATGERDEDDEGIYEMEYSDNEVSYSYKVNGEATVTPLETKKVEKKTEAKLEESSMSRVLQWMTEYQVAFITGFRNGNTKSTNQDRNYNLKMDLQKDLEKSDMYFIKVNGAYPEEKGDGLVQVFEETFAVVNDKYIGGEFKDIMVALANKYNQDGVLITYPPEDGKAKVEDNITSVEFDKNGNKTASYKGFSVSGYDKFKDKNPADYEYYTQVGNKKLSFKNRQEYTESKDEEKEPRKEWRPSGRIGAQNRHIEAQKYIDSLTDKEDKKEEE